MSMLASPSGAAADFMQIRIHIPSSQPAAGAADPAADRSSLAFHAAQLSCPPRSQLLQGESLHFYLLLPPSLLARHPWLQLPWGRKLIKAARKAREAREDEERFARRSTQSEADEKAAAEEEQCSPEQLEQRARASDASVLHRAHPCPHQVHIRLRVVGSEECAEARRQIRDQSCSEETQARADDVDEPRDDDDDDDAGDDIVHDPQANEERTDSDDEPTDTTERRRASMGSAASTTDHSSSSSHRRKSGTAASSSSSARHAPHARPAFAFRKSTLSLPSSASHARSSNARHHPSKLAPGYSPSFHGHSSHHASASAAATKEAGAPWNHVQSDAHASSSVAAPPEVDYFYFEPSLDAATAAQAGEASNQGPWLVLHVTTCISILPAYLSSPASMPFEQACLSSGAGAAITDSLLPPLLHLLSLELELVSPPAKHHQSLHHATLHLSNTGQFLLDNPVPGATITQALAQSGSVSAGTAGGYGYNNLRAFVAQNRALQVPHLIPPARSYVTVVEPLLLSSKSICLGSAGGGGGGDEGGCSDAAAAAAASAAGAGVDSSPPADICIEFTLLNLSSSWTLCVHKLDFLLNRSRIFLKILAPPPASASASASSAASPSASPPSHAGTTGSAAPPPLTLSSPANAGGLPPTPSAPHSHHQLHHGASRSEHRSVHYLPLGNFFPSSLDASALPCKLRPHEQLNLLCFLSAPTRAALSNLESMVRGLLAAGGSVSHPSFSLATTSLPYRTPYTLRYTVEGVGSQDAGEAIVAQNKTIWRSVSVANTTQSAAAVIGRTGNVPRLLLQSPSSSAALSPTSPSNVAPAAATAVPFTKLSLRLRVSSSPVGLHRPFAVFVSALNHHASLATNALQVVVLPETHEVVRAARESARMEEEAAAAAGRRRGEDGAALNAAMSASRIHPFSPSSPAPPLLFSPHTPFSPNTPWVSRDAAGADAQPDSSPRTRDLHFPFQAVGAAIQRRAGANSSSTQHASATPILSRHPISVHTGSENDSSASASAAGAGLSLSSVSRADSQGEVLTTTLAHFLSDDHPPSSSSATLASGTALTHSAAAATSPEADHPSSESQPSGSLSASSLSLSSLVCLETSLPLGVIPPQSDRSVTLHYLALREGLLALSTLFLFDPATHIYYRPMQQATVFAVKQ